MAYFWNTMAGAPPRDRLRGALTRYLERPVLRFLTSLGVSANHVTILGFLVAIAAACLAGAGFLLASGPVFLTSGLLDLLDGRLARYTGRITAVGALLDSVADRLSEGALFVGLSLHVALAAPRGRETTALAALLVLALLLSQTVSYMRARAEGLGVACKVGLMTRVERVALLSLGLLLEGVGLAPALLATVGLLAFLSLCTVVQRLLHAVRLLRGR